MKFSKWLLKFSGILILSGLFVVLLMLLLGGNIEEALGYSSVVTFDEQVRGIEEIDVDVAFGTLIVEKGESFSVECKNIPQNFISAKKEKGVWKIKVKPNGTVTQRLKMFSFNGIPTVKVTVPQDFVADNASFNVSVGRVDISSIYCKNLKVNNNVGYVNIEDFVSVNSNIVCPVGVVTLVGKMQGDSIIRSGMGSVTLYNLNNIEDFRVEIDNVLGQIKIDAAKYNGFNNEIKLGNNNEPRVDIQCVIGRIALKFYDTNNEEETD